MNLNEISKLEHILIKAGIEYNKFSLMHGCQLIFPMNQDLRFSAVTHQFSYGHEKGLIELMDYQDNDVKGNLTAKQVFDVYRENYKEQEEVIAITRNELSDAFLELTQIKALTNNKPSSKLFVAVVGSYLEDLFFEEEDEHDE